MDRLSAVIVTHDCREAVSKTLGALVDQLREGDEIVIVDNASSDGTPDLVRELAPGARLLRNPDNRGFAAAANQGAQAASGDLLVLLNPDAVPQPGFTEAIRAPVSDRRGWAAWMGLVTAEGGRVVNTSGGVVHFTGVAWAGDAGAAIDGAPTAPCEVAFASGACLAVPLEEWRRAGGFPEHFFMYCEDVDLSLRLRLAGGRVGIEPAARVDHDYDFHKGALKWRLLERNRWAMLLRTYPAGLLAAVVPALLATEVAITAAAIADGWGRQKLLAAGDVVRLLPRLLSERRVIQSERAMGAAEFAEWLTPELSSPYLGRASRSPLLRGLLRAYWRLATRSIASASRSASAPYE